MRAVNRGGRNHAHAACAIGVNDIDLAVFHGNARSPGVVRIVPEFTPGAENHAVISPVLHVFRREGVKADNIVVPVRLVVIVIHIGQNVEGITVRGARRVRQIVIARNRVISKRTYTKASN